MSITVRKLADGRAVLIKPDGAAFALTPEQQQQVVQLLVENQQNGDGDTGVCKCQCTKDLA